MQLDERGRASQMDIYSTFEGQELTASEFRRTFSISESASIQDESFPTIRVFQSRQSIINLNFLKLLLSLVKDSIDIETYLSVITFQTLFMIYDTNFKMVAEYPGRNVRHHSRFECLKSHICT